jgi:hypothetical protein
MGRRSTGISAGSNAAHHGGHGGATHNSNSSSSNAIVQQQLLLLEADPAHCVFLAKSLGRNDTELAALEKLHTQLRDLRQLIVERHGGESALFPDFEFDTTTYTTTPTTTNNNNNHTTNSSKEEADTSASDAGSEQNGDDNNNNNNKDHSKEREQELQILLQSFRVRLQLRRRLLNRLCRRLNRVAHFMDGETSNVVAPAPPRYGDIPFQFTNASGSGDGPLLTPEKQPQQQPSPQPSSSDVNIETFTLEQTRANATRKKLRTLRQSLPSDEARYRLDALVTLVTCATCTIVDADDAEAEARTTTHMTAEHETLQKEFELTREELEHLKDHDVGYEKVATVTVTTTTTTTTASSSSSKSRNNNSNSNSNGTGASKTKTITSSTVVKPASTITEGGCDGNMNTNEDDDHPPPDYTKISRGNPGIGATARSSAMSQKEKQTEHARWVQEVLQKIVEQPTFDELGMGLTDPANLYLGDERRRRALLPNANINPIKAETSTTGMVIQEEEDNVEDTQTSVPEESTSSSSSSTAVKVEEKDKDKMEEEEGTSGDGAAKPDKEEKEEDAAGNKDEEVMAEEKEIIKDETETESEPIASDGGAADMEVDADADATMTAASDETDPCTKAAVKEEEAAKVAQLEDPSKAAETEAQASSFNVNVSADTHVDVAEASADKALPVPAPVDYSKDSSETKKVETSTIATKDTEVGDTPASDGVVDQKNADAVAVAATTTAFGDETEKAIETDTADDVASSGVVSAAVKSVVEPAMEEQDEEEEACLGSSDAEKGPPNEKEETPPLEKNDDITDDDVPLKKEDDADADGKSAEEESNIGTAAAGKPSADTALAASGAVDDKDNNNEAATNTIAWDVVTTAVKGEANADNATKEVANADITSTTREIPAPVLFTSSSVTVTEHGIQWGAPQPTDLSAGQPFVKWGSFKVVSTATATPAPADSLAVPKKEESSGTEEEEKSKTTEKSSKEAEKKGEDSAEAAPASEIKDESNAEEEGEREKQDETSEDVDMEEEEDVSKGEEALKEEHTTDEAIKDTAPDKAEVEESEANVTADQDSSKMDIDESEEDEEESEKESEEDEEDADEESKTEDISDKEENGSEEDDEDGSDDNEDEDETSAGDQEEKKEEEEKVGGSSRSSTDKKSSKRKSTIAIVSALQKKKARLSLQPVPSFAQQDLKRIKAIQAQLIQASVQDHARKRVDEATSEYNATVKKSTELQGLKIRLQQDQQKMGAAARNKAQKLRNDFALEVAIAKSKWTRQKEDWGASKKARLYARLQGRRSQNGFGLASLEGYRDPCNPYERNVSAKSAVLQSYQGLMSSVEQQAMSTGSRRATTFTAVDAASEVAKFIGRTGQNQTFPTPATTPQFPFNVDMNLTTFPKFQAPTAPPEIDPTFLMKKQEEAQNVLTKQIRIVEDKFSTSEEERKRAWRKLQKLKNELEHGNTGGTSSQPQQSSSSRPSQHTSTPSSSAQSSTKPRSAAGTASRSSGRSSRTPSSRAASTTASAASARTPAAPMTSVQHRATSPRAQPPASATQSRPADATVGSAGPSATAASANPNSETPGGGGGDDAEEISVDQHGNKYAGKYTVEKVRERIFPDGSVKPVTMPKQNDKGLYYRPAGRQRKGMDWDAVNGRWIPIPGQVTRTAQVQVGMHVPAPSRQQQQPAPADMDMDMGTGTGDTGTGSSGTDVSAPP